MYFSKKILKRPQEKVVKSVLILNKLGNTSLLPYIFRRYRKRLSYHLFLGCCLVFFLGNWTNNVEAQNWNEIISTTSTGFGGTGNQYGYSVAIDGDYAVIGAIRGAAYILKKDATGNWTELKKLVVVDGTEDGEFGRSVSISGDYAIVGAPYQDGIIGAAYIFKKDEGGTDNWGQIKRIIASDRTFTDLFGWSVAIDGDYAVIGAYGEDEDANGNNTISNAGSAYIFKKDEGGADNWGEITKIVASNRVSNNRFGEAIDISGDYIIVGVYREDIVVEGVSFLTNAGALYVFKKDVGGTDNWGLLKRIVSSEKARYDNFGKSVAISGDYAVIGAEQESEDADGNNTLVGAGSAYILYKDAGGTDNWGEVKKIVASDRSVAADFSRSVAIDGDQVVVGAYPSIESVFGGNPADLAGSAYVFKKDAGGINNWGEVRKIVAADRAIGDLFGGQVAISGDQVIVGAHGEDEDAYGNLTAPEAGSVYAYDKDEGGTNNWGQTQKIVALDRFKGITKYGASVAISGNYAIVGAREEGSGAQNENFIENAGTAYILKKDASGNWVQLKKIVASDRAMRDFFGRSVAISGDYAVVGTTDEGDEDALLLAGAAYIYKKNQGGEDNWGEVKKIVASDRARLDGFGGSVSISGNYAIVGTLRKGAVYVYKKDEGGEDNWGEIKRVVASDNPSFSSFGNSVAMNGDYALIGSPRESKDVMGNDSLSSAGAIYVLGKDQGGTDNWGEVQKIVSTDRATNDVFGSSVAINETYILVGAPKTRETFSRKDPPAGSAYIFEKDGQGVWGNGQKVVASDSTAGDFFGTSVSLSGDAVVVGAAPLPVNVMDSGGEAPVIDSVIGGAYIFGKDAQNKWQEMEKVGSTEITADDGFGGSVSLDGEHLIVGAKDAKLSGKAYFFKEPAAVQLSSNSEDNILCVGELVTFTATSASGINFEFFIDDVSKQNSTSNMFSTNELENGDKVTVKITDVQNESHTSPELLMIVKAIPTATAGVNQTVCNATYTLQGNVISEGTGQWTFVDNPENLGQLANPTSPNAILSTNYEEIDLFEVTPVELQRTFKLKWTVTNAPCAEASDEVIITLQPPVSAGNNQLAVCGTSFQLGANPVADGTGQWQLISNPSNSGSLEDTADPRATLTGEIGTTYELTWQVTGGECDGSMDNVTIRFQPDSDNDTVQDCADLCEGGDDNINTDNTGMPDACDCDPNSAEGEFVTYHLVDFTPIVDDTLFADFQIASQVELSNTDFPQGLTFKAGNNVLLESGFHAQAGMNFSAIIAPCREATNVQNFLSATARNSQSLSSIEKVLPLDLRIAPNVAHNSTTLYQSLSEAQPITLQLFNQNGQLIQTLLNQVPQAAGTHEAILEVGQLPAGLYFVRMQGTTSVITKRLVVIK